MLESVEFASLISPQLVDITGGEPELYPYLRELVVRTRALGLPVRVRTNLVALSRPDAGDLPRLFAEHGVSLLASLPGTSATHWSQQRGEPAWDAALAVLRDLEALGYGGGGGLVLDLAYNPPLGELPRAQTLLEAEFRSALGSLGVSFDSLLAIANVPAGRYLERLRAHGDYDAYLRLLADAFNPEVAGRLACLRGLEIAWDGTLWDCDFNLGAGVAPAAGPLTLAEALADPTLLRDRRIGFGPHCYACTAGAGSS
jgi:radical SAM/Cys-rich protein